MGHSEGPKVEEEEWVGQLVLHTTDKFITVRSAVIAWRTLGTGKKQGEGKCKERYTSSSKRSTLYSSPPSHHVDVVERDFVGPVDAKTTIPINSKLKDVANRNRKQIQRRKRVVVTMASVMRWDSTLRICSPRISVCVMK